MPWDTIVQQYGMLGLLGGLLIASWVSFGMLVLTGKLIPQFWVDKLLHQNDKLTETIEMLDDTVEKVTDIVAEIPSSVETANKVLSKIHGEVGGDEE